MKKTFCLPFIVMIQSAMAATSADILVSGTIDPPSCDIAASGTEFAYGTITLSPTGVTNLSNPPTQTMNVTCVTPTLFGLRALDNRASTVPAAVVRAERYGLGVDPLGNNIGFYNVTFANIQADGASGDIKYSADGTTWTLATAGFLEPYATSTRTYAFDTVAGTTPPKPVTNASVLLSANAQVQPRNTLDTSSLITLDGSFVVELVYL